MMRQPSTVEAQGELKGSHVLIIIIAFFGVIISVNILLAVLANSTWSGFVTPNSYVASQNFNRDAAAARAQDALGWRQAVRLHERELIVKVTDASGNGLSGLKVGALLKRPTTDKEDHDLQLRDAGKGSYRIDVSIGRGAWIVEVKAEARDGSVLRRIHRLAVQNGG